MKKVIYALAIFALSLSTLSCGSSNDKKETATPVNPNVGKVEPIKSSLDKPITLETVNKKMNAIIDVPGTITIANPDSVKSIISKLSKAEGKDTYNCAILFTGTSYRGKIWNFTPNTITVAAEWKYEDGSSLLDTVVVESQKHNFSVADKEKGKTKTVTYNILKK